MPDFDYTELVDDADELITEFGRDVTLFTTNVGVLSDPLQPWEPWEDGASIALRAVITSYKKALVDAGTVQAGDKRVVIASKAIPGLQIDTDWIIIDGFDKLTIVDVDEKRPGPDSIVFIIQARS